jgi:hypothetical protein
MRPSGLASSGHYKDHADYLIFCGGWNIGRIYEIRIRPEHLRWFWALHFPGRSRGVTGSGEGGIRGALAQVEGVGQAGRCPRIRAAREKAPPKRG